MKHFRLLLISLAAVVWLASCEGDHTVIETDWTTLESVELQDQYNKYMNGEWEYQYDDEDNFIEMYYTFNTKDSTVWGYYNELIYTSLESGGDPEWRLLWQGEFTAKWVLLYSVDLKQAYIHMDNIKLKNVHGLLADYEIFNGRVLFYGATRRTLSVTTPITFRRIDMHHPSTE